MNFDLFLKIPNNVSSESVIYLASLHYDVVILSGKHISHLRELIHSLVDIRISTSSIWTEKFNITQQKTRAVIGMKN